MLLMDEATVSLDPQTEALIAQAIARLARARTVLVIAHRLRTVRRADCILVMDSGRVVEQGTHDILARGDTRYARMVRAHEAAPMGQTPAAQGAFSLRPAGEG